MRLQSPTDSTATSMNCHTTIWYSRSVRAPISSGCQGSKDAALTIKTLNDAIELRNRLITHLEEASSECAADQRQPLLTFVVAGAGFAGVETLGGINDLFARQSGFIQT